MLQESKQARKYSKLALGFGWPPSGTPLEKQLEKGNLTNDQLANIFPGVRHELTLIHAGTGEGFGWINPLKAFITHKFVGKYDSWHEFLLGFYDEQGKELEGIKAQEKETGKPHTILSKKHREQFDYLYGKRDLVRGILEKNGTLLSGTSPQLLHGNLYAGSIFVDGQGHFKGLGDFSQMLIGDPLDDIAYLSVMPKGDLLAKLLQQEWANTTDAMNIEEKMHLYRLWESYRKIYTRYKRWGYLDEVPEPLVIAIEEIKNITGKE